MSKDALTTYLNDHIAGSVAALELLDHLIPLQRGTAREEELVRIRREVAEDQNVLVGLVGQVGGKESGFRNALARITEKFGRLKLRLDDPGDGAFRTFEAIEALALGIQGKAALWRALASLSSRIPEVRTLDYAELEQRAEDQFSRVERIRLEVASEALSS
jgi:hypothetical protein